MNQITSRAYIGIEVQTSANVVRRQENDLSLQPVLVSQKFIEQVVVSKKYSRQSIINNSWLIRHMICSIRIMFNLAILLVIFNNAISKKRTRRLANTFWRPMGAYAIWTKTNFASYANVAQSLNGLWTTCRSSTNAMHASTRERISSFLYTFAAFFSNYCPSQ